MLSGAVVDQPLPTANPHLAHINDQEALRYLARLNRSQITDRVQAAIIGQLASGKVSTQSVAKSLHMSTRTLQRLLRGAGTSFRSLLEATREELARAYLGDDNISLTQKSFMLGFSDPSAFTRAYQHIISRRLLEQTACVTVTACGSVAGEKSREAER